MKTISVLGAVAVLQIGLVAVTWWPSSTNTPGSTPTLMLDIDDITEVSVSAESGETVLALHDDEWVVRSAGDYPAKQAEVDELLDALDSLRQDGSPIATQAVSHVALGVDNDGFDRKVRVRAGDNVQTLFIGRGGAATLHVRSADSDEVFEARGARLASLPANASAYVDSTWVSLDSDTLTELRIAGPEQQVSLEREGDSWRVLGVPPGREVDSSAVDSLVRSATTIRLSEPADVATSDVATAVTVHWANDEGSGRYVLGTESDGKRLAYTDDSPHTVRVSNASIRSVVEATVESLLVPLADPAPGSE